MKNMIAIALLALCSCEQEVGNLPDVSQPAGAQSNRYVLKLEQTFQDRIAYGSRRGVYTLTDTETGRTWIGISGIGVSETGMHSQQFGKTRTTVQDER